MVIIVITYVPLVAKHIIGNAVVNKVNDVKESFTDNEGIMRSFTIYNLVMGKYQLFNIDYHNVPLEITKESPVYDIIKHSVVKFYYYLQKFSIKTVHMIMKSIEKEHNCKFKEKKKLFYNYVKNYIMIYKITLKSKNAKKELK